MPQRTPTDDVELFAAAAVAAIVTIGFAGGSHAHQPRSVADIVEETALAVVTVHVEGTEHCRPGWQELWRDHPIEHDSEDLCEDEESFEWGGSGFVIDPGGYIVTNHHVIIDDDAATDSIEIEFLPDLVVDAEINGADRGTDIALLKVDADSPLPFIRFGNSEEIRVGDRVLAIGTPVIAEEESASVGIVSARNRAHIENCLTEGYVSDYIQTDAAINPGNSGGPLLDADGDVIGVISRYGSPDESFSGVGFAVPSRIAEDVVRQLRARGHVQRGWLGFDCHFVDEYLAESLGLEESGIAIVTWVNPDSPAADAGLQSGDVILEYDGRDVREIQDLLITVSETEVGRRVRLRIWRQEQSVVLTAMVGLLEESLEDEEALALPPAEEILGMSIVTVDAGVREILGLDAEVEGVLVTEVAPDSSAYRAEIEPGEVIEEINFEPVRSARDVLRLVKEATEGDRNVVPVRVRYPGGFYFSGLQIRE